METTYADSWSEVMVNMTYISHSSDFALYLEDYLMFIFDLWTSYFGIMSQYNTTFDLKINVGHCDFALYLEDYLIYEHHTLGLWVSMTRCLTSKYL